MCWKAFHTWPRIVRVHVSEQCILIHFSPHSSLALIAPFHLMADVASVRFWSNNVYRKSAGGAVRDQISAFIVAYLLADRLYLHKLSCSVSSVDFSLASRFRLNPFPTMYAFAAPSFFGARLGAARNAVRVSSTPVRASTTMVIANPSPSMPFLPKPKNLSEDMIGYTGFGMFFFVGGFALRSLPLTDANVSTCADPLSLSEVFDVKWLQQSEIKHGRIVRYGAPPFALLRVR